MAGADARTYRLEHITMAEITAALVKTLRDKSGVGMMDCKKALQETQGDVEAYRLIGCAQRASRRPPRRLTGSLPRAPSPWPCANMAPA